MSSHDELGEIVTTCGITCDTLDVSYDMFYSVVIAGCHQMIYYSGDWHQMIYYCDQMRLDTPYV